MERNRTIFNLIKKGTVIASVLLALGKFAFAAEDQRDPVVTGWGSSRSVEESKTRAEFDAESQCFEINRSKKVIRLKEFAVYEYSTDNGIPYYVSNADFRCVSENDPCDQWPYTGCPM